MKSRVLLRIISLFFVALLGFKLVLLGISALSFQHSFLCKINTCIHHESTEESDEESENKRLITEEKTEAVFFEDSHVHSYPRIANTLTSINTLHLPSVSLPVPTPPPDPSFI